MAALCCLALTAVCPFAQSRALDERWLQVWNEQYAIEQQLAQYLYAQREDPTSMTLSAADQQTIQTILAPRFASDDVRYAAFYAFSYTQGEQAVSYTHLDVYKRQPLSSINPFASYAGASVCA